MIFQTIYSARSNILSLKSQSFTPSSCNDKGIDICIINLIFRLEKHESTSLLSTEDDMSSTHSDPETESTKASQSTEPIRDNQPTESTPLLH